MRGRILTGGIFRDGKWRISVGDTRIQGKERAIVACMSQHLKDVQSLFLEGG